MHHRSHDNNRELTRQVHKILDECATKLKDDPRRYTSMFIKEKLNKNIGSGLDFRDLSLNLSRNMLL